MSKIATPALSAALAAGATALVWTLTVPGVNAEELSALRHDQARLRAAADAGASNAQVKAVADEYAATVNGIARAMTERSLARKGAAAGETKKSAAASADVTPRGHRNHGIATPHAAVMTFTWASDICDPDELAKVITFDPATRPKAVEVLATMPEAIRQQYPTPEAFFGLVLAATCLEGPPPGADLIERNMTEVELKPDRFAMRRRGSERNEHEYQLTADGWKFVIPEGAVTLWPGNLNSQTLARLSGGR